MSLWYENAVIYSLDVRTFQDSNGDGVGDFDGLLSRLDYLSSLGVTALWLQPFFPSPMHDAGYDVTDYFTVDDQLGGMAAFVRFAKEADRAGLRIIIDLPVNHTSIEHPWFRDARSDRDSPYRDFYIWVDEPPPSPSEQVVFRSNQPDPWTYDEEAGQHYFHRFYDEEPDLNHANPRVREHILRIIEFWLSLGASGIRIDAAPYIAEKSSADPEEHGPHPFLQEMHEQAIRVRSDAMLMAEADVKPAALASYFGDGTEMQMLFDFLVNNYFFLALAREEAEPLVKVLGVLPHRPRGSQWANWVRNHDELDLERLSSRERADVMEAFAPDESMQVYGRGIRRRFPPMVAGDRRRVESAYALLFALPGTPIIRYGEEIGMGDDLALPERASVRTAMQWSRAVNGGFSSCDPSDLRHPVISEGEYGFEQVNVAFQQVERDSFMSRMHLFIAVRRQHPEIGVDEPEVLRTGHDAVFALKYANHHRVTVVVHNLSSRKATAAVEQLERHRYVHDILGDRPYDPIVDNWEISLPPYGYRWIVADPATAPEPGAPARAAAESIRAKPE